ncbi:hypothetical protein ACIRG5_47985 [Lentzea sp. NPDC102401]|uniref:hypothetical protein n=1 Tax=Lentzea sp. NPDC102401 TaxID=3364128 RepID=UPI0037F47A25
MWPTVHAAIEFVLGLQRADGTIPWLPGSDITLRAGCSSIHHAIRSASHLAHAVEDPRPSWSAAAGQLADAIRGPEKFLPKPHSMDWYYPVLGGVLDTTALSRRWHEFVVAGLGVRCVDDQPWVTGGETAELALVLAVRGHLDQADQLLRDVERLRDTDGSYWTGYQYENDVLWPDERTTWTAGAVLLAHAALAGEPATTATFTPSA